MFGITVKKSRECLDKRLLIDVPGLCPPDYVQTDSSGHQKAWNS